MSSFISFLSASPNPTNLRTNPSKPYLLPIHGGISSSSAATMPHNSRQKPIADARNLESGSGFDPYASFYPESDVMRKLLRERMVFLMTEIDASVADMIIFQLMMLDFEDPDKDIKLFINSSGGFDSATKAIYDVVQFVRADVSTIALGTVASTPSMILSGGTIGKRLAMPKARIVQRKQNAKLARIVQREQNAKFLDKDLEQVRKDNYSDRYMSPGMAVRHGLIDGIIARDFIVSLIAAAEKVEPNEEKIKDLSKFLTPLFPRNNLTPLFPHS